MIQSYRLTQGIFQNQNRTSADWSPAGGYINRMSGPEPQNRTVIPPVAGNGENQSEKSGAGGRNNKNFDSYECQTCENRKYQDGSDDPGVSFKTAAKLSPEKAASSVRAHENEHVSREQAKARREGREVVSQSVSYHTGVCPECGRVYVSGGTTRTVTRAQVEQTYGIGGRDDVGNLLDLSA